MQSMKRKNPLSRRRRVAGIALVAAAGLTVAGEESRKALDLQRADG